VFCFFSWLLRLLGFGGARGAGTGGCDADPAARARWQERRRRFRDKLREAFEVWREDDGPEEAAPAAGGAEAAPARPADPLED